MNGILCKIGRELLTPIDGRPHGRAKPQRARESSRPYKKDEVEAAFQKQPSSKRSDLAEITYEVVEHDGGWAYLVNGVFSEAFPTHALAHEAAERAAREQVVAGENDDIRRKGVGMREQLPQRYT